MEHQLSSPLRMPIAGGDDNGFAFVVAGFLLIVSGSLATAAGPHSGGGAADKIDRFGRLGDTMFFAAGDIVLYRYRVAGRKLELRSADAKAFAAFLKDLKKQRRITFDLETTGLDPLMQHEFSLMVGEARARGRTVFLSSHNLAEVERMCDRVAIIKEGRIVVEGPPSVWSMSL